MNIYNLPEDKNFINDIMNDLKRAKRVVLISPFLSINVINEWRDVFKNGLKEDFTVVYETNELSGEEKGLQRIVMSSYYSEINSFSLLIATNL